MQEDHPHEGLFGPADQVSHDTRPDAPGTPTRLLAAGAAVAALVGVGGFFVGRETAPNHSSTAAAGTAGPGGFGGGLPGGNGGGLPGGGFAGRAGGLTGTVQALSGNRLTLQTPAGALTVTLGSGADVVQKAAPASRADLRTGETVTVTTTANSSGRRTASRVIILPD